MTPAEKRLWFELRGHKLAGVKFRRQAPIGEYVVDFLCFERKLVIEVDGSVHDTQKQYDQEREEALRSWGYTILRFSNEDVLKNLPSVLRTILQHVTPLPVGERAVGEGTGER